jgi:cytochrome c oxidase subunit 2
MKTNRIGIGLGLVSSLVGSAAALAQPAGEPRDLPLVGIPTPGGVNYQPAVTEVAHDVHWLSGMVHGIMLVIVLLVVALIVIVAVKFNKRANPTPARWTHNTKIEIAWTLIPVVVLILIGSFSLPILFKQLEVPPSDLTIKATGNQWYWSYNYPANNIDFDALMLAPEDLEGYGYPPETHLLATDNAVVVPVGKVVHLLVTGADVIHAWAMPSFGVKIDAIPGRLNETWFRVEREGVYFGQCSELCGRNHSFMPITLKAVSQEQYDAWLNWAIDEYGGTRPEAETEAVPAGGAAAAEPPAPAEGAEPAAEPAAPAAEEPAAEPAAPAAEPAAPAAEPAAPAAEPAEPAAPAAEPAAPAAEPAAPAAQPEAPAAQPEAPAAQPEAPAAPAN